ncbi:putative P-loop containing nucleoside triphosphate hydrolase, leucine-rich repeat domain superfamily [Helianthus annuus]|nr:putative P-loop containing nucleoside triphosphate hydrolase, leucine-rich repeat domain superfamily [Helianthus annuus]
MAEVVLSSLLPVLFEKLTDAALKTIARHKGIDAEIKKLQKSLTQIQVYLTHASQMEINDPSLKQRLNDLQHLAYDIDDVLDGWETDAMDPEFKQEPEGITGKVRKLITPTCCTTFSRTTTMIAELDDISTKLQDLVKEKADLGLDNLGLKVEEETRPRINNNRRLQTSVVDPSGIVGRQAEKDALVQQLLLPAGEPCDKNYSIVPIIGMGGVGKTTLAGLLYNDDQVKKHFELKAWICISDEFDISVRSKEIFIAFGGEVKAEHKNFNKLQEAIRDHLTRKRFLLVLDDVWSESREDWETLVRPFYTCSPGSKIIVTTRKDVLLNKLGYNSLYKHLESLSDDDALSLFALHAGVRNFDSRSSLKLKPYGEGIVKKCKNLPLALKALGTSLSTKKDEDSWKGVLESEIWTSPVEGEVIPALRLSYHDLSAPLKRLFAYCSLFPKDFLFDKEDLVLLWMAEGFFQPIPSDSTKETLGHQFFDELLSRSFFQHAPNNESLFVMHDLMNDLATSVATEFYLRLDNESWKNIKEMKLDKYRHMSFVREEYVTYEKLKALENAKCLRTFLATFVGDVGEVEPWRKKFYLSNQILTDLLPKLPLLRVLSLSGFEISELPESIGTLRHLRYLNLSQTHITHLPEKLQHLDVRDTLLSFQMLLEISKLKSLQITLSKINIESESGTEIAKLKDFKNLYEKISVVGLEKVQNATYAHEANFSQKKLSELELVWSDEQRDSRNEMLEKAVLSELKPCDDKLIQLEIRSYGGLEFPNWIGDPLFLHLKHVSIRGCKSCTSLPPLGQLPSLKKLVIEGLYGVEAVGSELFGTGQAFPSLETLSFEDMRGWKKWSGGVFPRLQKLEIEDCPNLVEVTLEALPSLNVLGIWMCDSGVLRRLVEVASAVTKLKIGGISRLNDVVWGGVTEYLGAVEELWIQNCNEIRYLDADASKIHVTLRKLEVWFCDNLVSCSCSDGIEELILWECSSMTVVSFPKGGQEKLKRLAIWKCRNLLEKEWEWGGQKTNNRSRSIMPMLEYVSIHDCMKLLKRGWGGQKTNNRSSSMPMLEYVYISDWRNLKSIIELNCLVHLTQLIIENCENLETFPDTLTSLKKLKALEVTNCPKLDFCFLPGWVWPPNLQFLIIGKLKKPFSEWGPQSFPTSLVELRLYGGGEDGVNGCSQFSHLLPSSLTSLQICGFEKLESVSMGLQHLTSLHHLTFHNCPKMMDLPEMLLPSLLRLVISGDCPEGLKERCSKNGSYWPLISHIPCLDI